MTKNEESNNKEENVTQPSNIITKDVTLADNNKEENVTQPNNNKKNLLPEKKFNFSELSNTPCYFSDSFVKKFQEMYMSDPDKSYDNLLDIRQELEMALDYIKFQEENQDKLMLLYACNELGMVAREELREILNLQHSQQIQRILRFLLKKRCIKLKKDGTDIELEHRKEVFRNANKNFKSFYEITERGKEILTQYRVSIPSFFREDIKRSKVSFRKLEENLTKKKKEEALKKAEKYSRSKTPLRKCCDILENHKGKSVTKSDLYFFLYYSSRALSSKRKVDEFVQIRKRKISGYGKGAEWVNVELTNGILIIRGVLSLVKRDEFKINEFDKDWVCGNDNL